MKSCLLTLDEIETGLEKEFAKLEPEISGYRLRKPGLSMSQLQDVETALETNLPDSFKRMVRAYDFGDLTVGGVFFGQTGNYGKFLLIKTASVTNIHGGGLPCVPGSIL